MIQLLKRDRRTEQERDEAVYDAIKAGHKYGPEIAEAAGIKSGTVYPSLIRLEQFGVVTSHWEVKRPGKEYRRRIYKAAS